MRRSGGTFPAGYDAKRGAPTAAVSPTEGSKSPSAGYYGPNDSTQVKQHVGAFKVGAGTGADVATTDAAKLSRPPQPVAKPAVQLQDTTLPKNRPPAMREGAR